MALHAPPRLGRFACDGLGPNYPKFAPLFSVHLNGLTAICRSIVVLGKNSFRPASLPTLMRPQEAQHRPCRVNPVSPRSAAACARLVAHGHKCMALVPPPLDDVRHSAREDKNVINCRHETTRIRLAAIQLLRGAPTFCCSSPVSNLPRETPSGPDEPDPEHPWVFSALAT